MLVVYLTQIWMRHINTSAMETIAGAKLVV